MRALLVAPRIPGTGFTGDRVRAELHLSALARAGFETTLVGGVSGGAKVPRVGGAARVVPVVLSPARAAAALGALALAGEPLQTALFAGSWGRALSEAGGPFDLAVVLLVRAWPFVRAHLPAAPLVLDYVDALSEAARRAAARERSPLRRAYWRAEAPRLSRLERAAGERAVLKLATAPFDAAALPAGTRPLGHGVRLGPRAGAASERASVVAFSGRLGYRPNVLAVEALLDVWPRVRAKVPGAVLAAGGADAPPCARAWAREEGVTVTSPLEDVGAFLRRARVAAMPLALGTGVPNKLLEAFEAGTPVVAPSEVLARAVDPPCAGAFEADSADALADRLVELLRDDAAAARAGAAARTWAEAHADREAAERRLAEWLADAAKGGA